MARGEHRADSDLDLTVSVRTRGTLIDDARLRGRLVALGFRPYHDAYLPRCASVLAAGVILGR